MLKLASLFSGVLLGACSIVGVRTGTPEPAFQVVAYHGPIEIRRYGPRIAAETTVQASELDARSQGFRRLAGYIFGANTPQQSIAMTAPVAQSRAEPPAQPGLPSAPPAGSTIGFFMPARETLATLPHPTDPSVRLTPVPAQTIAVLRFTGSTDPSAVAARQAELAKALAGSSWRATAPAVAWFYDPPWTLPFLRRNEVAVPVEPATNSQTP